VSFFGELRRELVTRGVDARRIRRIVLELEDHLACDPEAKLGAPSQIAARFAAELRIVQTRRATIGGFGALALSGVLVASAWLGVSAAGGWPDLPGVRGGLVALGGLVSVLAGQVSFVAGVLGVWLWLRRPDELWLVQRRMVVALRGAGLVVAATGIDAVGLRPDLPGWWFALSVAAIGGSAAALVVAAHALRLATALTPLRLRRPAAGWQLSSVLGVGLAAVAAMSVGNGLAERSWLEGATRGVFEAVAFAACFLALGRVLGLRRSAG